MLKAFGVLVLVTGCGDNLPPSSPTDAPLDASADAPAPDFGTDLSLLTAEDPAFAFNASREVLVAAHGGVAVIASINEHFPDPHSFDQGAEFRRRVAINVTRDGGATFGPAIDPDHGMETSDPVVRVSDDGTFTLATLALDGTVAISRSATGTTWSPLTLSLPVGDKEWFAFDDANQQLFVAGEDGCFRLGYDGTLRASNTTMCRGQISDAYADDGGVHFALVDQSVVRWSGIDDAPTNQELAPLDVGNTANEYTSIPWRRAPFDGGIWSVRARRDDNVGSIVLRIEAAGDATETTISGPGANAFLPAAAIDASGRLHVAYYDSSGAAGRLLYIHSVGGAPYADGFTEPRVIDPNAVPAGFYPFLSTPEGGRRLREYIGIAVDEDRVYIAWTHSPEAPSRVRAIGFHVD